MEATSGEPGDCPQARPPSPRRDGPLRASGRSDSTAPTAHSQGTQDNAELLKAALELLRRNLDDGLVHIAKHGPGRVHISANLTLAADANDIEPGDTTSDPSTELEAVQDKLQASRARESRLQEELAATEVALEYTRAEVANLWRILTTRNLQRVARHEALVSREQARMVRLAEQRSRIRSKVNDVREIARKRRWPWSLVG